jgi:hypothetical protein
MPRSALSGFTGDAGQLSAGRAVTRFWPLRPRPPYLGSLLGDRRHGRIGLWDTGYAVFHRCVRVVRPVVVSGSIAQRRFDWTSTRWMSTPQKPLPVWCVYCDRQRYWLGLPRIAHRLDRLDSSSLGHRPGRRPGPALGPGRHRHRRAGAGRWRTGRAGEVGGATAATCRA